MITKFKIFESNFEDVEIGDYVLIKTVMTNILDENIKKSKEFVETHIGQCIIVNHESISPEIIVLYKDIPKEIHSYFHMNKLEKNTGTRIFSINRIVAYGKTPEEVEIKMNAQKYNL